MLTLSNLKEFKKTLDLLQVELNELIKVRSEQKLFKNSDEYYLSLKACKWFPQDYFKFRLFDSEIELKFNNKQNKYYIHIETIKSSFYQFYEYKEFFKKHKIKPDIFDTNFYIEKDYKFEQIVQIFCEFIIIFIHYYLSQDKLFYFPL